MLRKKIVSLEEQISNKSEVEREKDEESVRSRKLMKLAEKYKRELNEAHVELRDLRARCLTVSDVQVRRLSHCKISKQSTRSIAVHKHALLLRKLVILLWTSLREVGQMLGMSDSFSGSL